MNSYRIKLNSFPHQSERRNRKESCIEPWAPSPSSSLLLGSFFSQSSETNDGGSSSDCWCSSTRMVSQAKSKVLTIIAKLLRRWSSCIPCTSIFQQQTSWLSPILRVRRGMGNLPCHRKSRCRLLFKWLKTFWYLFCRLHHILFQTFRRYLLS